MSRHIVFLIDHRGTQRLFMGLSLKNFLLYRSSLETKYVYHLIYIDFIYL